VDRRLLSLSKRTLTIVERFRRLKACLAAPSRQVFWLKAYLAAPSRQGLWLKACLTAPSRQDL